MCLFMAGVVTSRIAWSFSTVLGHIEDTSKVTFGAVSDAAVTVVHASGDASVEVISTVQRLGQNMLNLFTGVIAVMVFLGLNQTVQYFSNEGLGVPAGIRMPRGGELIAFSKSTFSKSYSMSPAIALGDIGWITDNTPEPFPFLFENGNADIPRTVSFQEENEVLPYLAWVNNLLVYKYCPNYDRIMEATLTGPPDHCHGFWAFHVKAKNRNYT